MKRVQKIVAVMLAVVLLVSSGVPGMASVFAADVKDTEAVTERMTEHAAQKTGKSAEAETAHMAAEGEGKTAGKQTESETQKQTESEAQKQTESETQKQTESETQKQTESETAETKKPLPMEPETKEPETQKTEKPKKTVKANGVSITAVYDEKQKKNIVNDSDLASLIPDLAFRQAVYDNFEKYNWLAGDPENPPSPTDENGNPRARIEILKEILGTYRGPIDASNKGINSIAGIQYLKIAATDREEYTVDLTSNNIKDVTPIADVSDAYHYGGRLYCSDVGGARWRNVEVLLLDNPMIYFPKVLASQKLGYIVIKSITENDRSVKSPEELKFYFLRKKDGEQEFDGFIQVGYCHYYTEKGDFIPLAGISINECPVDEIVYGPTDTKFDLSDEGYHKNINADAKFSGLKKSSAPVIGVGMNDVMVSFSRNPSGAFPITNSTSISYSLYPTFTVFDLVTIKDDAKGSFQIRKVDGFNNSKGLEGAEFKLYTDKNCTQEAKKVVTGEVEGEIVEREEAIGKLVTGRDGYTQKVQGLRRGKYYYKEIKAPEGYAISDEVFEIAVGYDACVDGGLRSLHYTNPEESELEDVNVELDQNDHRNTYVTWKMEELYGGSPVDFYLRNGENQRIEEAANGEIKKVTVKYASLDGTRHDEVYTYNPDESSGMYCVDPLTRAQDNLNDNIKKNKITGSVSVEITYNDQDVYALSVAEAENMPAVDVKVDKAWKGIDLVNDKDFPNVSYTLYRYQSNVTYAEEKEKTDGASEEELKAFEKQLQEELEQLKTEKGKAVDSIAINSDTAKDYIYTFKHLPKYAKVDTGRKDAEGNAIYEHYLYLYDVEEKVMQGDEFDLGVETEDESKSESENGAETSAVYDFSKYRFEDETVADKTGLTLTKKENDGQLNADLLTYSITNYRKAIVEITKHDASGDQTAQGSLKGVEFKLEKADLDENGNVVSWSEMKDINDTSRFITDDNGKLQLRWLGIGKYRLTETKTWAAYILLPEPLEFEITKQNMQTPNNIVYMVSNNSKYDVPKSGGIGTIWFYVSGCLLILIGGLWVYRRRFSINRGKE